MGKLYPWRTGDDRLGLYQRVAKNVRKLRISKEIGTNELAETIHTSPQSITKIESGDSPPPLHLLYAIATVLGVTMNDLVPMETKNGSD